MFDNMFIWAQVVGLCGLCINIITWQLKSPRHILMMNIPSYALWSAQYFMLGAPLGAIFNLCSALRDGGLIFVQERFVPYVIVGSVLLSWSIGLYFFAFWYDAIPMVGGTIMSLAFLQRNNRPLIARVQIICSLLWLLYDALVGSYIGFSCTLFIMVSAMVGIYRHEHWDRRSTSKRYLKLFFTMPKHVSQTTAF